jgi:fluoroquinolone transport system permease protein
MKHLAKMVRWYFLLDYRFYIIHISFATVILWVILLHLFPSANNGKIVSSLIFLDPAILGFVFIGTLILYEKTNRSLYALTVTPMEVREYLLTHIITLTSIATAGSLVLVALTIGLTVNYLYFFPGIILTSAFFVLAGFIAVSRFSGVNDYFIAGSFTLLFLNVPLIYHFGLSDSLLFYLFPTQASLLLFSGIFEPVSPVDSIYSVVMLSVWVFLCYMTAEKMFYNHIASRGD